MVDSQATRDAFFGTPSLNANTFSTYVAGSSVQDQIVNAIKTKAINTSLATQPDPTVVDAAIRKLLNAIANNPASQMNPNGSGNAMKAACGAALGSAATTVQ